MTRKQFIETLFDVEDLVAWGDNDAYCSQPKSPWPEMIHTTAVKFCINPLKGKRCGDNVTHIVSLLFEMDKDSSGNFIPKDTQIALFKSSGLPYSTMTWSGTKSVHVIVRLDKPVPEKLFRPLWLAISRVLTKKGCSIDPATMKIPQISRMPMSIRDNENIQELLDVRSRVSLQELGQWLKINGERIEKPKPQKPFVPITTDKSNYEKFKIARKWSENKQVYSSAWTTGGHMWLFTLGINLRKLECDLDQGIQFAKQTWGNTCETGMGPEDIMIPITKGWHWIENKK